MLSSTFSYHAGVTVKKLVGILFICSAALISQVEHLRVDHKAYSFFERMSSLHILSGYDEFQYPISRGDVAKFLSSLSESVGAMDKADRQLYDDLLEEFSHETGKQKHPPQSLIEGGKYELYGSTPRYIYQYEQPGIGNLFINLIGETGYLHAQNDAMRNNSNYALLGGEIRGTLLGTLGFFLSGSNGNVFGNKAASLLFHRFGQNWKLSSEPDARFFDETEGYFTFAKKPISIKFGRDRFLAGYGSERLLFESQTPLYDHLAMNIELGAFKYSYMHGKLLGEKYYSSNPVSGGVVNVDEKYIGYHRLSFSLNNGITLGAGEMIIYAQRGLDFSYLNPFAFYKTVEHGNQDRDNSLLFFDMTGDPIPGLQLYATLLIDDIDYSKIGTGWYGNQTALHAGLQCFNLYPLLPLDFYFDYYRIEPYVFSHRLPSRSYTNNGHLIGVDADPNSGIFRGGLNYRLSGTFRFNVSWYYREHGANPIIPASGETINVGGSVFLGHREGDSAEAKFLSGIKEYFRKFSFSAIYEPVLWYHIKVEILNEHNSEQFFPVLNSFTGCFNIRCVF